MSIFSLIKFKVKQTVSGEKSRGLLKFLAPDILIGVFLAISSEGTLPEFFPIRVALVASGVILFTSLAETRRFFYSGGDIEKFYFVRPTAASRIASVSGLLFLDLMISAAVFVPVMVLAPFAAAVSAVMILYMLLTVAASVSVYFVFLFLIILLPPKAANRALTFLQVVMALALLAAFQLSVGIEMPADVSWVPVSIALAFMAVSSLFVWLPASEAITEKLGHEDVAASGDLTGVVEKLKRPMLIRSEEEKAGVMFVISNLLRSSQFRLSTIGISATPVMVAVYWTMQRTRFMSFSGYHFFYGAESVAPAASLVVSGIVAWYFLSQNVLSSREYEASWIFGTAGEFDAGRFVLGVRKGLLVSVHVPVTFLILMVSLFANPAPVALATAATYYFMVHVAASWFSVMQRRFPFSVPFTPLGVSETVNLVFMLSYSFLSVLGFYFLYGNVGRLLMVNLLALILVGVLEYSSVGIVNKRVQPGVR